MADDLSNISTVAISSAGEALREFKHLPDKRRRERPKGTPIALENLAEEELIEDDPAEEERLLDVSA
jgi:hypothetical protein